MKQTIGMDGVSALELQLAPERDCQDTSGLSATISAASGGNRSISSFANR